MLVDDVHIDKMLIYNDASFSEKGCRCFTGYKDDCKMKQLCVILPNISGYVKCFDETKYTFFH